MSRNRLSGFWKWAAIVSAVLALLCIVIPAARASTVEQDSRPDLSAWEPSELWVLIAVKETSAAERKMLKARMMASNEMKNAMKAAKSLPRKVKGCASRVKLRGDLWTQKYYYATPFPSGFFPSVTHTLYQTAMLFYWYCPNKHKQYGNPRLIKGKYIENCWFFNNPDDEEHTFFDGVLFRTRLFDNSERWSDSGGHKVSDDNTRQNCETDDIPVEEEIWMKMKDRPRWRESSQILRKFPLFDEGKIDWEHGQTGIWNYIHPLHDMKLG